VVRGYPWESKNPLALSGKDGGFAKQSGIGHDLARSTELVSKSGNAGWQIHRKFLLIAI
jgi:hypothetical protein